MNAHQKRKARRAAARAHARMVKNAASLGMKFSAPILIPRDATFKLALTFGPEGAPVLDAPMTPIRLHLLGHHDGTIVVAGGPTPPGARWDVLPAAPLIARIPDTDTDT